MHLENMKRKEGAKKGTGKRDDSKAGMADRQRQTLGGKCGWKIEKGEPTASCQMLGKSVFHFCWLLSRPGANISVSAFAKYVCLGPCHASTALADHPAPSLL